MAKESHYAPSLLRDGFVEIPVRVMPSSCTALIDTFTSFIEVAAEAKTHYGTLSNAEKQYQIGYYEENREDRYQGNKQIFHYNRTIRNHEMVFPNSHGAAYAKLKDATEAVFEPLVKDIKDFFNDLDAVWRGLSKQFFGEMFDINAAENFTLRLVRYTGTQRDNYLIEPHFDRGTCTFVIADNAPGLRLYPNPSDLSVIAPYRPSPKCALFMPGINFKIATNGDVAPLWHDVVASDVPSGTSRVSILMFADIVDVRMFSYQERYDRELWHGTSSGVA